MISTKVPRKQPTQHRLYKPLKEHLHVGYEPCLSNTTHTSCTLSLSSRSSHASMAAIISHIGKSSDFEAEVFLETTPYENWYFISRGTDEQYEYYSAHEDQKHVFFTEPNDDIWNWEMWTAEEFTTTDNQTVHLLKSSHDTYIHIDQESGAIWQIVNPSSCNQPDLITLDITEVPEPYEAETSESDTEPAPKPKKVKKTPPPSDSDSDEEPAPKPKKVKKVKKTPPPSDSDSDEEPAPKPKKVKKTPPPSDSDSDEEPAPKPKKVKKTKKETAGDDKPKRKPNIKLIAFQLYCKDNRPQVKEESPEAKLGEQQKILGEWWKQQDEEVRVKYEKMAKRKAEDQ